MATITFEVSKTGTAEYFMEDEDYEVLINEYGGDVRKFIRELEELKTKKCESCPFIDTAPTDEPCANCRYLHIEE